MNLDREVKINGMKKTIPSQATIVFMALCDNTTCYDICKQTGVTFSHLYKVRQLMEQKDLITTKLEGRCKNMTLTNKGIKISKICKELLECY